MRLKRLCFLFLACLLAGTAAAQQPLVRVEITPDVVPVGERANMRVTVLVPTWFTGPPTFPSFELANAITRLPPDSSYPTSERVGGETWSGIVRNYEVYPLAAATYRMDDLVLSVSYAHPDTRRPTPAEVAIPTIELRSQVPNGAQSLDPYLSGSSLTLSLEVDGEIDSLEAGDAVVLEYTAELDGLPAMFLPPLFEDPRIPGVSVYAEEPIVTDDGLARRTEKVTLVFDAGGEFTLPQISLDWWDSRNREIKTASVEPLVIAVEGAPIPVAVTQEAPVDRVPAIRLAVIVTAILALLVLLVPRVVRHVRAARQRRRESEEYAFKRLQRVLLSGDERNAHHELIQWLDKAKVGSNLREFAAEYGDDVLSEQLDLLSRSLYENDSTRADLRLLRSGIGRARRKLQRQDIKGQRFALPPLNP